jgi:hypothetical protein
LTRDNSVVIEYDLQLPMTNSATMAQRVAFRILEQQDNQVVAKLTLNARGAKCAIGDVVSVSISKLGWTSKTFRVIEWQRNNNGTYDVSLREDESASYTDPLVAAYVTGNSSIITVPSIVVPPPSGFGASSVPYGIKLSWTNPASDEFDFIDVYVSSSSAWSGASLVASVRTNTYTFNVGSGQTRYFWLRARRNNGDVSLRTPNSDTSTVSATAGAGTDSINIVGATLSDQQVVATAEAAYRLTSGGLEESLEGTPVSPPGWDTIATWLLDGSAGDYFVELTKSSGTDPTSGPALSPSRHQLSTTREWVWTDSTQNDVAVTFEGTVTIYDNASPQAVLGSANLSVTIDAQTPDVTLSGTSGSPNVCENTESSPDDCTAGWRFNSDGTVDKATSVLGIYPGSYDQFASGVQWISDTPLITYYIRFTLDSGDSLTSGTTGSWLALTSNREFYWRESGIGQTAGTVKVEIDTVGDGSNIVATGYYRGEANVDFA